MRNINLSLLLMFSLLSLPLLTTGQQLKPQQEKKRHLNLQTETKDLGNKDIKKERQLTPSYLLKHVPVTKYNELENRLAQPSQKESKLQLPTKLAAKELLNPTKELEKKQLAEQEKALQEIVAKHRLRNASNLRTSPLARAANNADSLALVKLYETTNGAEWNTPWDLNSPVETWNGVTLNTNGIVTSLSLTNNNMTGYLPRAIGDLTGLQSINFSNNRIEGAIPTDIGKLTFLSSLTLNNNPIGGAIPEEIGNLTNLGFISMLQCQVTSLPSTFGQLSSLWYLDIRFNRLTSLPSSISNLTNLQFFVLTGNQVGSIPNLSNIPNLAYVWAGSCGLSNFPTLPNSASIFWVIVSSNNITNINLPTGLTGLSNLAISSNPLTVMPNLTNAPNLRSLYAGSLSVNGSLTIPALPSLTLLDIANNGLTSLPNLSGSPSLQVLYVRDNELTSLPDLSGFTGLLTLFIQNNQISSITNLGGLSNLQEIRASDNPLTLNDLLPLAGLSNLNHIEIGDLGLSSLPNFTGLTNLNYLSVENNKLTPADIEPYAGISTLLIGNQTPVEAEIGEVRYIPLGGSTTLAINLPGAANSYRWFGPELSNEINNTLNITNMSLDKVGDYQVNVFNSSLSSYFVNSEIITLRVLDPNPVNESDSLALVDLYQATDGANWVNTWDLSSPVSTWYGVVLDGNGRVARVQMRFNQLKGNLPPSLSNLTELTYLDLAGNQLMGKIPESYQDFPKLEVFFMVRNQLEGKFPEFMTAVTSLTSFGIDENNFSGEIPASVANWTNMRIFGIGDNNFTGTFPDEMEAMTSLERIFARHNHNMGGAIPASFENLPNLNLLSIGHGSFTNIPDFAHLPVFTLFAYGNKFGFADLIPLQASQSNFLLYPQHTLDEKEDYYVNPEESLTFGVSDDHPDNAYQWYKDGEIIDGATSREYTIPSIAFASEGVYNCLVTNPNAPDITLEREPVIVHVSYPFYTVNQSDSLALVDIYNALGGANWTTTNWDLTKPVSTHWDGVRVNENGRVWSLRLFEPNTTGQIPTTIGNLTELELLTLVEGQTQGNIPAEIGSLTKLTSLFLYENQLSGTIPESLGDLGNVEVFSLFENELTGTIPTSLDKLVSVTSFSVSNNQLEGTIPAGLGNLPNLERIFLHNNKLTGTIPISFGNLNKVTRLLLYGNRLTGTIPAELGGLAAVQYFYVHNNQLTGTLPASLGDLTNMLQLIVENNQLEGDIPSNFTNLSALTSLYLNNNQFTGIPDFSAMPSLQFIFLDNNRMTFEDIDPSATNPNLFIDYNPQDKLNSALELSATNGQLVNLSTQVDDNGSNQYQWFKQRADTFDSLITGATASTFSFTYNDASHDGYYYCQVISTVGGTRTMTLNRHTIAVNAPLENSIDRAALIALYNATDGPNWLNSKNWLSAEPLDTWLGVTVKDGRVTEINLTLNKLAGAIPTEIGNLSKLQILNLWQNDITSLPSSIGNLTELQNLSISFNQLSTLPSAMSNLTNLTFLDLSSNPLGVIPAVVPTITSLTTLQVSSTGLTSLPSSIGQLVNLRSLWLNDNELTTFPASMAQMTSLSILSASNNEIVSVPADLLALSVDALQIPNNKFKTVPRIGMSAGTYFYRIDNNEIPFGELEPVVDAPALQYIAQRVKVGEELNLVYNLGDVLALAAQETLSAETSGNYNRYTWKKDDVVIQESSDPTLDISVSSKASEGTYTCTISNTYFPNLTFEREPIHVHVNVSPSGLKISSNTIDENEAAGTVVGMLSASDDRDEPLSFSLVDGTGDADNASFTIVGNELRTNQSFNYEDQTTFSLRIRIEDSEGGANEQVCPIQVINKNDAPTDLALSSAAIDENQPTGTSIGDLSTTDEDAGDTFMYALVAGTGDTDNGQFTIDGATIKTGASFDFEMANSYSIRVQSTDAEGATIQKVLGISVNDINEMPMDISLTNASILENETVGSVIGQLSAVDPDLTGSHSFTLIAGTGDTDNGSFTVDGNELKANAIFDFETKSSYAIRLQSTDQGGLMVEKAFTISVENVNEAPFNLQLSNGTLAENEAVGTVVGNFTANDPDAGTSFTFSLATGTGDTDNGSFEVVGDELRTLASFDFENKSSYSIRINVADQGGASVEEEFTISITDANDAPSGISLTNLVIDENEASNTQIGDLSTTDDDAGDSHSYELVSGAGDTGNGSFSIVGNEVRTAESFDFEAQNSYSIRVKTTDAAGASFESNFTISVNDINEQPTDISLTSESINENQAAGAVVGTLSATDPDMAENHSYALVSGSGDIDNGAFAISGDELRALSTFDFEAKAAYSIRVQVSDQGSLSFEKVFVITVNDENEAPFNLALSNTAISENQAVGASVGIFSADDPDANNTLTYSLVTGTGATDNADFQIVGEELRTAAVFNFETKSAYSIRVQVADQDGATEEKVFAISVNNENDAPTSLDLSNATVDEEQAVGTAVGTLSTTDEDAGDTHTYALVSGAGGADNGSFTVSGNELRTNAVLNFEIQAVYSIRLKVTDANNASFETTMSIAAQDINESPTALTLSKDTISENRPAGTVIGLLTTDDPDNSDTHIFELVAGSGSQDNGDFAISDNELKSLASFDFETKQAYSIRVRVTDQGGESFEKVFVIIINDVDESVTAITFDNISNQLSVFPNPAVSQTTVELNNNLMGTIQYRVYSTTGKVMLVGDFTKTQVKQGLTLDVAQWASGLYIIEMVYEQKKAVKTIQKQ